MSLEIPLLIREKIDDYLYFRVWQNRIRSVISEYGGALNKYYSTKDQITCTRLFLRDCWKFYNFRNLCFYTDDIDADYRRREYIRNIRNNYVVKLPKHYYHIILKEIL